MIQQGINQLLTLSAVAAKLDPRVEQKIKIRESESAANKSVEAANVYSEKVGKFPTPADIPNIRNLNQTALSDTAKAYSINPTEENLKTLRRSSNTAAATEKFLQERGKGYARLNNLLRTSDLSGVTADDANLVTAQKIQQRIDSKQRVKRFINTPSVSEDLIKSKEMI